MKDRELGRLLSGRNQPSVLEKEAGFEKVMRAVQSGQRWRRGALLTLSVSFAAAALLWLRPALDESDPFAARGAGAVQASFAPVCIAPDGSARCVTGGKLTFELTADKALFFAAFAQRSAGTVIWYWPLADGKSLLVSEFADAALAGAADARGASTAIMLDQLHPPGPYTVFGIFSEQPLDRAALKRALGADLRGDGTLHVVSRTFRVEDR